MKYVSNAWKQAHKGNMVPVSHIRIGYIASNRDAVDGVSSVSATYTTAGTSADSAYSEYTGFVKAADLYEVSSTYNGTGSSATPSSFVTLGHNNWIISSSVGFFNSANLKGTGFVGNAVSGDDGSISDYPIITINFDNTYTSLPGLVVRWSDGSYGYAKSFTINVYNGSTRQFTKSVTGNTDYKSDVEFTTAQASKSFNKIEIVIKSWSLPQCEPRIYNVQIGKIMYFNESNVIDYNYSGSVDPLCTELPQEKISFTIDNVDGSWDPENPSGNYLSLSNGQLINVEYGYTINGSTEYVDGGTFYLTGWECPSDGVTMSFEAESAICLLDVPFSSVLGGEITEDIIYGTPESILTEAIKPLGNCYLSIDSSVQYHSDYGVIIRANCDFTCAEVIQLACNAAGATAYFERTNSITKLVVKKYNNFSSSSDYVISSVGTSDMVANVYSSKYEKNSAVNTISTEYTTSAGVDKVYNWYGSTSMTAPSGQGITQTFSNDLIYAYKVAIIMSRSAMGYLNCRNTISGEFRIDPRLCLMDLVRVKTKYNTTGSPLLITSLEISYNGAYTGAFEGRIIPALASYLS